MKEISLLQQTFFGKVYVKKILRILKMKALLFMVMTFNMFGTLSYTYGHVNSEVKDKTINILPYNLTNPNSADEMQQIRITGTVTDALTGQGMIGVNIQVKGTTIGAISDGSGKYTLSITEANATLVFSFIGYVTQNIPVAGKIVVDVALTAELTGINEVVIVGYGTQKKVNLTGSVTQITSEKLENRPVSNVGAALQGLVAGLNVSLNSLNGGEPGAVPNINIRGLGSLSGGSPYLLVDGVPMDIRNINQSDVESVSVLKDAASSAIYGSRAPYGVILITTKSGKKGEKPTASYSSYLGWSAPTILPKLANSLDFSTALNDAALNSGMNPIFTPLVIDRIKNRMADPTFPSVFPDPTNPSIWGFYFDSNDNINYYDVYFKDWSFQQNHNFSIKGGGQNLSYYVGAGWVDQGGQLNFIHDDYQRYNLTSNLTSNVTNWLKIELNTKFTYSYNKYPVSSDGTSEKNQLFNDVARAWPTEAVYTPNGDLNIRDITNVPYLVKGGSDKQYTTDLWFKPSAEIQLTKDWKINVDLNFNINNFNRNLVRNKITGLAVDGITPTLHWSQTFDEDEKALSRTLYISPNVYSKFEKKFNDHFLGILAGWQVEQNNYVYLDGWKKDFVTELVPAIRTATGDKDVIDNLSSWSTQGYFARLNYNYKEKYLLEVNGRYDGSSRFAQKKQWGFFPSVSAGYNISRENFWNPLRSIVNNMKIRGSYGTLGNQNVANYLQTPILPINTNLSYLINGVRPVYTTYPNIASINLTWETSKTLDFGTDMSFLSNKLDVSFDWYDRKTENMFGPGETLPAVFGTTVPKKNNATLDTKGFDLSIGWKQSINDDLRYNLTLTLSDYKSVVTQYNNPTKLISTFYNGMVLGEIWGYETAGYFTSADDVANSPSQSKIYSKWSAGDVKYKDLNGDGIIYSGTGTVGDPGDMKVIGNMMPRYIYGINMNINYKNFDFGMFWQGVGKRDVWLGNWSGGPTAFGFTSNYWSSSIRTFQMDYWTSTNTGAFFPKPYVSSEGDKNQQVQTKYLQNGAYLRLKNLQIGYTLPVKISEKLKIENLRLYVSGENILTFSGIHGPYDPEALEGTSGGAREYPMNKTYSVGINVTFK